MGATLSAGLSLKWLNESILKRDSFEDLTSETEDLEPGSGGLIYLPYLTGERTPHMDPEARGVFFGLSLHHKAANLVRAVMEGVAYSFRESLDIFHELGIKTGRIIASGGGARSHLWRRILSDVFGEPVSVLMTGRCGNPSPSKFGTPATSPPGNQTPPFFPQVPLPLHCQVDPVGFREP